ncbi:MAG: subclass B3 metallo-beta-lactamase [Saccharospirillaceae bacterium]|nr:subclass B3 metallo-beta-lactamase [Saccharospirillaceae bacterium]
MFSTALTAKQISTVETDRASDWVKHCAAWDDWDKPGPPFRIFGNSYYVGTCGISAILITGDKGHILIDSATVVGADLIAQNISQLGFSIKDVKLLLNSHEHFDHVAGLARLQQLSGAKLLASLQAAPVLRSGISAKMDPQAGLHQSFAPARVDGFILDGEVVRLGNIELTAIYTPGHTPGAVSWVWQTCEEATCHSIVYADSLSPISNSDYKFSDYPDYVKAYQAGLKKVAGLDCQILLAPHPSASKMHQRLSNGKGLIDAKACINYIKVITYRLNQRLMQEKRQKRKQ